MKLILAVNFLQNIFRNDANFEQAFLAIRFCRFENFEDLAPNLFHSDCCCFHGVQDSTPSPRKSRVFGQYICVPWEKESSLKRTRTENETVRKPNLINIGPKPAQPRYGTQDIVKPQRRCSSCVLVQPRQNNLSVPSSPHFSFPNIESKSTTLVSQ